MSAPIVDNEIKLTKSNQPLSSRQASLHSKLLSKTDSRRHIVLIGAGFAGIRCLEQLAKYSADRITLVDRNDYHFFPPLIYQVSAGFLASSDISYPLRRYVSNYDNIRYRQGTLLSINIKDKQVNLDTGDISYDCLIIATGAETNYFGNKDIETNALPMKTIKDALSIRNHMLAQFNYAASLPVARREPYLSIVIAGGGPSGVELAGVMSEIRRYTLHKEYPELLENIGGITLVTADPVLLAPMSAAAQNYAQLQMENFKVDMIFSDPVASYDGHTVTQSHSRVVRR